MSLQSRRTIRSLLHSRSPSAWETRYYFGQHFGFASAGLKLTVPLAFIPQGYGKWQVGGSAQYFYLGETPANLTNGGDRSTAVSQD